MFPCINNAEQTVISNSSLGYTSIKQKCGQSGGWNFGS